MKLGDFIEPKAIVPQLQSTERDDVIAELIDSLVAAGALAESLRDEVVKKVLEREKHGSTGFGKGVAVPHVKHSEITKMAATIGVSAQGVDFKALDKAPVFSIVLLMSPAESPDEHLQAMENIFRNLQKDTFRRFLRQASTTEEILDLIHEADTHQLQG
ncbi:MAG: PTS sugar transporter subunit IIA [Phycisphaera sp.]|nr:PTS sugar transporter subunit IIA [Phycisphaera sp.]